MQHEFDIAVKWTAFPLHPETPKEGMTLEDLFAGRPINVDEVLHHLIKVAAELGLPFGERKKTYNSRLAQELGKFAENEGSGEQFHLAVFRAYFGDGLNIGLEKNLISLGSATGLPEDKVCDVLENRTYKKAVDEDWHRSYQMGVTAVPTFVIDGKSLVGAQPYEKLVQLVESSEVVRRT